MNNLDRIDEIRARNKKKEDYLKETQNQFDQILKGAYKEPWWRQFVKLIKERRLMLSEQLEAGIFETPKEEERTRGQISELKMILSLDQYSEQLQIPMEDRRAT